MKILPLDIERLTHGIKTAFACLVGYAITKSVHLPVDQWLIITILVVMCAQINVGSMIQKSYMRFLGTLCGSIIAALTLTFFGVNTIAIAISIVFSAFIFSYIATGQQSYNEAGTLGAVTVTIILIGQNPTITSAIGRFFEISAGIIIAALVAQFVLPIHARNILLRNQAETIRHLRDYYISMLVAPQKKIMDNKQENLEEIIVKSFIAQRKLATEAAREPFGIPFNIKQFSRSLSCEREILHSITFMRHAYNSSPAVKAFLSQIDALTDFHQSISQAFDTIAESLRNNNYDVMITIPHINSFKNIILTENHTLSTNDVINVNAFLFCAEILVNRMELLISKKRQLKDKK